MAVWSGSTRANRMMALCQRGFHRADAAEYRLCLRMNRACQWPGVRRMFAVISRLGDGVFWYTLMLFLPVAYGEAGLYPGLRMALVGVIGLLLYKYLKSRLVRERPYITLAGVVAGTRALDRYSFPSGHTLHAVSFTVLAVYSFPALAWLCIPFAALVAASRVVLGLHYPSDVLAGAGIGAGLAVASIKLLPL
ncbi:MAG: phosphatase PAP2 family protein [Steroidobacteraceae bacterium]